MAEIKSSPDRAGSPYRRPLAPAGNSLPCRVVRNTAGRCMPAGIGERSALTIRRPPDRLSDVEPKPAGLDPSYASQFNDPAVVRAYNMRPPYAAGAVSFLVDLAGGSNGRILDLGCGTGELTRRMSADVHSIIAMDRSPGMVAAARRLPGGDAPNVEWIVGRAEDFPLSRRFTLAVAAESFHWFDWDTLCARLSEVLGACPLVLVDRCEVASPWETQLRSLIATFSTNRDFQRYDLVDELIARRCYSVRGRRIFGPEAFAQSIDDYITSIHSRNGFSRDRMNPDAAFEFDCAVRAAVQPYAGNDALTLQIETRVVWGRMLNPAEGDT